MDRDQAYREIDALIEAQRDGCLWFARPDFRARSDEERRWALTQIQRRCDREVFAHAARLKRWLSPTTNDASAGS